VPALLASDSVFFPLVAAVAAVWRSFTRHPIVEPRRQIFSFFVPLMTVFLLECEETLAQLWHPPHLVALGTGADELGDVARLSIDLCL